MTRAPIIFSDFDDTMNQLIPAWIEWINKEYNYNINFEDVHSWDLTKVFIGLTQDDICKALHNPQFWKTVEEKPNAAYYIQKLIDEGYEFYICTSTDYRLMKDKFDNCLFRLFPFIDRHNIITTYNKQLMRCDVLIDDGSHNIKGEYLGLLMDMPHNKHIQTGINERILRVTDWAQIYELIHKLFPIVKEP